MKENTIWTIGHSTRSSEAFLDLLQDVGIRLLVDVRSYPGSKRHPQFNRPVLEAALLKHNINYLHLKGLGGGKNPKTNSVNTAWQFSGFRGYADHMASTEFNAAMARLETEAEQLPTAYMCAEAAWRNCHRSLISDYLKAKGWNVLHLVDLHKKEEHPYTKEARLVNGQLSYHRPDLFS